MKDRAGVTVKPPSKQTKSLVQLTLMTKNFSNLLSVIKTVTNLSMRFAVQVCEKIKHGTRGDVTVFAPVVSSVIVFKRLRSRGRGTDGWFVWRRSGRRRHC